MYAQVEKPKENKSRAIANSVSQKKSIVKQGLTIANFVAQKKSSGKQGFGFVDNRPEATQAAQLQAMAVNVPPVQMMPGGNIIQTMRPNGEGWYLIKEKGKRWYKGEPEQGGYFKFYSASAKKMSQMFREEDIEAKYEAEDESENIAASSSQQTGVGFGAVKVRTFEKEKGVHESDPLLSENFSEQPGDFDPDYQTKVKLGNKYYERIQSLITEAKRILEKLPQGYVGLWRFHMSAEEYQSHAYREASQKQEAIPREVLVKTVSDLDALASHMYESSRKHTSPAVSFTRSIDSLIDASFHTGADSMLRAIIFGGKEVKAAKFLSFVAIPKAQLVMPENVPIPKGADRRDRKGEARARSMKELEALHIPLPESGGRTYDPKFTVENPFPEPEATDYSNLKTFTVSPRQYSNTPTSRFVDNRPEAIQMQRLPELAKISPQNVKLRELHHLADTHSVTQKKIDVRQGSVLEDNRPEAIAQKELQELADNHSAIQRRPTQKNYLLADPMQKTIQRMLNKDYTPINNQAALNAALLLLNPPVRGMIPAQYQARGATPQMLDAAIAASNFNLYDGMSRGELLRELRPRIDHEVTNTAANYAYDPHGDKHFPGGPPGTKFNGGKAAVNPQLVALITAQIGRIRRDASGNNQSYYYTLAGIPECGGNDLTIQVDYTYAGDIVTYHGYPDNGVVNYSLSRVKNGAGIP